MVDRKIVTAGSGDFGALVRLCSALFVEDAGRREYFLSLISRDGALCLLARSGRTPVGYLAGYVGGPAEIRPVRIAEIESVYVGACSRGGGVGSALVDGFLAWARKRMAGRVSVTAYASNGAALRFYGRRGFGPRSVRLEMAP